MVVPFHIPYYNSSPQGYIYLEINLHFLSILQGDWLPTLRNLVAQINGTFSHNFQEMAVAGEVSLGTLLFYKRFVSVGCLFSYIDWFFFQMSMTWILINMAY